ncbi:MAG TPA: PRC and DUF2382 domain-containing protein [Actinomycetales bacterium]|jgi:uncharacterized protein (TIGR02271 family)|nr:PRC and DUF2382 domain-containing protein [Actinomycetales bacterium]
MISDSQAQDLIGATAYDAGGDKIGKVGQVYFDDQTGHPEWVTVNTGFFGTSESFVPLREATFQNGDLRVPYDKTRVKDAPNIDETAHLEPEEEDELYRYYGIVGANGGPADAGVGNAAMGTVGTADAGLGEVGLGDAGPTRTGDDVTRVGVESRGGTEEPAMTRSEEELRVGTESRATGRARLRKYVTTEHQSVTVPVTHEEVRVVREPITDENRGEALQGADITEAEHEVTLHEEVPVVSTEVRPKERVRLDTEEVTEQEQVGADVRKEHIDIDTGETGRT